MILNNIAAWRSLFKSTRCSWVCVLKKDISKNEVFELSFLDELWQAENWGFDEETLKKRKEISIELNKCISFLDCL